MFQVLHLHVHIIMYTTCRCIRTWLESARGTMSQCKRACIYMYIVNISNELEASKMYNWALRLGEKNKEAKWGEIRILIWIRTYMYIVHVPYRGNTVVMLQVTCIWTSDTSTETLAGWDSLVHINLQQLVLNNTVKQSCDVLTCKTHMPYVLPRILCVSA